jgi:hypothetical protein
MPHTAYFALLATLAIIAAILLRLIDPWVRRAEMREPSYPHRKAR